MSVSTHVLDASAGRPAAGVTVRLERRADTDWAPVSEARTDAGGRVGDLGVSLPGVYRLSFATGAYFDLLGVATFYPEITVAFEVTDPLQHYHVPLLLSPFAYSTYRGS